MNAWMRASDADREQTVAALRTHVTDGRITMEEFSERSAAAYAARTLGDLDAVTADLPAVEDGHAAEVTSDRSWARPAWLAAGVAALTVIAISLFAGLAHAAAAAPMMSGWCH
jgi:Domain of unknown function (DUF1707)